MFSLAGLLGGPAGEWGGRAARVSEDQLLGSGFACAFYFDDTILDSSLVLTSGGEGEQAGVGEKHCYCCFTGYV